MRTAAAAVLLTVLGAIAGAQDRGLPPPLPADFALARLAGTWYEVASYGDWAHRGCVRDTEFQYVVRSDREIQVTRRCTGHGGLEMQRVRLRMGAGSDPRWKARIGSGVSALWPWSRSDHRVVAIDPDYRWYAAGDDHHGRLSVLSRTASLDEASMARAIAAARAQGYDVGRLVAVPQGPPDLSR